MGNAIDLIPRALLWPDVFEQLHVSPDADCEGSYCAHSFCRGTLYTEARTGNIARARIELKSDEDPRDNHGLDYFAFHDWYFTFIGYVDDPSECKPPLPPSCFMRDWGKQSASSWRDTLGSTSARK